MVLEEQGRIVCTFRFHRSLPGPKGGFFRFLVVFLMP